jgi:outer membrane protein assembly factor BamB
MRLKTFGLFALACLLGGGSLLAANWPFWRGPLVNGVAPGAQPPLVWSETNHVKWKVRVPGAGTSTPIIWGNQVFLLAAMPNGKATGPVVTPQPTPVPPAGGGGQRGGGGGGFGIDKPKQDYDFLVLCFNRQTGRLDWQQTACSTMPHEGHHKDHGFASASPVTDGRRLFAWFGSRGLFAYDLSGRLLWKQNFGRMQTRNSFGEGSSPALYQETLVVLWDHEGDDFIVALDAATGKERWRQAREESTGWTTPLIVQHGGRVQVLVSGTRRICAYDLETGKLLWDCEGMTANAIPTPVTDGNLAYFASGFRGNALLAIRLGRSGTLTATDAIAWRHDRSMPYVPSPLLYEGNLYCLSGNNATVSCFDALSGKPHYEAERLPNVYGMYASPVGADGRVYLAGRDGKTVVLKQGRKFEILATNVLDDKFDASPVAVDRELFLRGHDFLYCLTEGAR